MDIYEYIGDYSTATPWGFPIQYGTPVIRVPGGFVITSWYDIKIGRTPAPDTHAVYVNDSDFDSYFVPAAR